MSYHTNYRRSRYFRIIRWKHKKRPPGPCLMPALICNPWYIVSSLFIYHLFYVLHSHPYVCRMPPLCPRVPPVGPALFFMWTPRLYPHDHRKSKFSKWAPCLATICGRWLRQATAVLFEWDDLSSLFETSPRLPREMNIPARLNMSAWSAWSHLALDI